MGRKYLIPVMVFMLLQLAWVDTAGAFSFCFSSGGGGNYRSSNQFQYMPAIGFRQDYWEGYTDVPVVKAPAGVPINPWLVREQDVQASPSSVGRH